MDYFVHPTSIIDPGVQIGKETKVWHFSHISEGAHIGSHCSIGQNAYIGRDVRIGNRVKIQNNVSVYQGVEFEDGVFCGPSTVFTNDKYPRSEIDRRAEFKKTYIRKGATLGANTTIICGIEVGAYAFIGAGAVVTKDIPPYALCVGVPAEIVGWVCECAIGRLVFLNQHASCPDCAKEYRLRNGIVQRFDPSLEIVGAVVFLGSKTSQ